MTIVTLQGLDDLREVTPYNGAAFGALVFVLAAAVVTLWYTVWKREKEHNEEKNKLRTELKEMMDTTLKINGESIPILTNVITALNNNETINKDLVRGIDQLKMDHSKQLDVLSRIAKNHEKDG